MYPGYTPCESQKQPKGVNSEVQNCLEFNLASMYLPNSCAHHLSNLLQSFCHLLLPSVATLPDSVCFLQLSVSPYSVPNFLFGLFRGAVCFLRRCSTILPDRYHIEYFSWLHFNLSYSSPVFAFKPLLCWKPLILHTVSTL